MKNTRYTVIGILLCVVLVIVWGPISNYFWPPPKPRPNQESVLLVAGAAAAGEDKVQALRRVAPRETAAEEKEKKEKQEAKAEPKKEPPPVVRPVAREPIELIGMGYGIDSHLQVLLNTQGASVQQVIVTQFQEADRLGLAVKDAAGKPEALPLVPGIVFKRTPDLKSQKGVARPVAGPGIISANDPLRDPSKDPDGNKLADPCYVMYHYEKASDERPADTLGMRNWKVVERELGDVEQQRVVFETELAEPHFVKIRKTYTLKRNENHVGLRLEILPLEGRKGAPTFRYQMTGAHGLPIEGEWYTSTFHIALTGFEDKSGNPRRTYEDAREIRHTEGGERHPRAGNLIRYAGVAVQYFASVLVVDNEQPDHRQEFLEYVRSTPYGPHYKDHTFLDDVTVRAISEEMNVERPVTHQFLLYQGPVKVRLLRQLEGDKAVPDALVDRYLDVLHLGTLTDAPMPNALGRFANSIYWTDLVIAFTNLIHSLLYYLNQVIPSLGLCILVVTLMVRGCLFPISRKQAINNQKMQQKMAKLAPELRKIQEKYGQDFHRMQQEKTKLYLENGINPLSAMSGCLLLLLQMPIFMGLYYALQESVFFRLAPFLPPWILNLAAPDMLVWWGEGIPILSDPESMGGALYLGPFLNILPIVAVALMLHQQKKMMPMSDDPQVQAQQKMMKWMMILFGLFFYKVAAGLCIYFIASTLWGIFERRYIPKLAHVTDGNGSPAPEGPALAARQAQAKRRAEEDEEPKGWFARKKAALRARVKELMEEAQKQGQHRNEPRDESPDGNGRGGPPGRKKKKRR
jgi:YidC/Oxa1 family membrane protein insertase